MLGRTVNSKMRVDNAIEYMKKMRDATEILKIITNGELCAKILRFVAHQFGFDMALINKNIKYIKCITCKKILSEKHTTNSKSKNYCGACFSKMINKNDSDSD